VLTGPTPIKGVKRTNAIIMYSNQRVGLNVNGMFNKKRPIENTVEVNIYYQGHRKRIGINVIGGQKWNVILEMSWLAYYNPEIDWRTGEVNMMRYLEECRKQ